MAKQRTSKRETHYKIDEPWTVIEGPKATAALSVHDDGEGVIVLDAAFWSKDNNPPKDEDGVLDRGFEGDIEGFQYWDLSPQGWIDNSKEVSRIIGRKVTLEEGGYKTDWKANRARAENLYGE